MGIPAADSGPGPAALRPNLSQDPDAVPDPGAFADADADADAVPNLNPDPKTDDGGCAAALTVVTAEMNGT